MNRLPLEERVLQLARHLESEVFVSRGRLQPKDTGHFFLYGLLAAGAYFAVLGLGAGLSYVILQGFLWFLWAAGIATWTYRQDPPMSYLILMGIRDVIPWLILGTGLFLFLAHGWRFWKRFHEGAGKGVTDVAMPPRDQWFGSLRQWIKSVVEVPWGLWLSSLHPELASEPYPYAHPAAGILCLIAREEGFGEHVSLSERLGQMKIPGDGLVIEEAKRLLFRNSFIEKKESMDRQGRELHLLVLTETGEHLVRRFGIRDPDPLPDPPGS